MLAHLSNIFDTLSLAFLIILTLPWNGMYFLMMDESKEKNLNLEGLKNRIYTVCYMFHCLAIDLTENIASLDIAYL